MLLFLAACARVHGPAAGEAPPLSSQGPSLLDGPGAVAAGEPLHVLDERALAALLANDGAEPLVVNFWATWCGPCARELDVFRVVAAEEPAARFALVSVDAARDRAAVLPFLAARGVALPAYHLDSADPSASLARVVEGWPNLIPVTLIVEPGGAVRARFDGVLDETALRAALAD